MMINVSIKIKDDARRDEVEFAVREVSRIAANDIYLGGIPTVDELREIASPCLQVVEAQYFRSE